MPRDDRLDLPIPAGAEDEETRSESGPERPARAPRRSRVSTSRDAADQAPAEGQPPTEGEARPRRRAARAAQPEAAAQEQPVAPAAAEAPAKPAAPARQRRQAAQQQPAADQAVEEAQVPVEGGRRRAPAPQQQPAAQQAASRRESGQAEQTPQAATPRRDRAERAQAPQQAAQPQAPATSGRQDRQRRGEAPSAPSAFPKGYVARLRKRYEETIAPTLMQEFGYKNPMQVPWPKKVVLNIGVGEAKDNARALEAAQQDLTIIAGQKPVVTKARKSIANFKLREGMSIGAMVTLRGNHMWDFLDRLMNVALPRTRDFRGVPPNGFDGRGNFSLGLREQIIFPEVDFNQIDKVRGLQINVVTSARNDDEGRRLLELLGMPFSRPENR